jgi:pSer/pThr/pTyr-binding forkhead associated (FHA) protein/tetratricopeptide (TPR) repeat protein
VPFPDEAPPDEVPEEPEEAPPVDGTVVTTIPPRTEPALPPRRAPSAEGPTARRPKKAQPEPAPDPFEDESQNTSEGEVADPRATRILSLESMEGPAKFTLVVTKGPSKGTTFPLRNGALTVGRSAQCDVSILDEAISRKHFELQVDSGGVAMRDLGSGNGTLVNGERTEEVQLSHGDLLSVGDTTLELRERGRAPISTALRAQGAVPTAPRMAAVRTASPSPANGQKRRQILIGALAVATIFIVILAIAQMKAKQQRIAQATALFERGRQELEQGEADEALEDFQRALAAYPDPNIIQEKAAIARVISDGNKTLTHARDLVDQKDFTGARKVLDGVPHNSYLDSQVKQIRDDIDKREAELHAAEKQLQANGLPIDPTTAAEANEYWQRGKKEKDNVLAAEADFGRAYDMLANKGAGGEEFNKLKRDYVDALKQVYERFRRESPAKAELALEKANSIIPESIPTDTPVPNVVVAPEDKAEPKAAAPAAERPARSKHTRTSYVPPPAPAPQRHHASAPAPKPKSAAPAAPAAKPANTGHYDEAHAEELDDAGDALLGQDPAGAKQKYREALKFAPPSSDAASRARAGLSN